VERLGERIRAVDWTAEPVVCEANGRFRLRVDSVLGGAPPFAFQLDGEPSDSEGQWNDLPSGVYELEVRGEDGCRLDTLLRLDDPLPIQVELGPDLRTEKGVPLRLAARVTGPWDSLVWEPNDLQATTNPLEKIFRADATQTIVLTASNSLGCSGRDSLTIQVVAERIYLPTAFSPNGDGANDVFYVQAGEDVVSVKQMSIFDRWGNRLYFRESFRPNDPSSGWDGRSGGQRLMPGVYLYLIEVEVSDGRHKQIQGEIQLLGSDR
jgi:gliding motility-associated-like protein